MGIQKLTQRERAIRNWRIRRNQLAHRLMANDINLTLAMAIKIANRKCGPMPR